MFFDDLKQWYPHYAHLEHFIAQLKIVEDKEVHWKDKRSQVVEDISSKPLIEDFCECRKDPRVANSCSLR